MGIRMSEKEFDKFFKNKNPNESYEKHNKFKNNKVRINDILYDSTKEYERHCFLQILEKNKDISNLRFHDKKDDIILLESPLIKYKPDFCYTEKGKLIVEDFKGFQTKEFIIKKKIIISMINNNSLNIVFRIVNYQNKNFEIIEEYEKKK